MRTFLIIGALGLVSVSGCGGDDDPASRSASTATTETQAAETTADDRPARTSAQPPRDRTADSEGADDESQAKAGTTTPREYKPLEGSERDEAAAAVRDFFAATADRDGDRICALLSDGTKEQFERALSQAPQLKGKDCPELIELTTAGQPKELREGLKQVRVTEVFVKDEFALARYTAPGQPPSVIPVSEDDGRWHVGALGGTPADRVPIP